MKFSFDGTCNNVSWRGNSLPPGLSYGRAKFYEGLDIAKQRAGADQSGWKGVNNIADAGYQTTGRKTPEP